MARPLSRCIWREAARDSLSEIVTSFTVLMSTFTSPRESSSFLTSSKKSFRGSKTTGGFGAAVVVVVVVVVVVLVVVVEVDVVDVVELVEVLVGGATVDDVVVVLEVVLRFSQIN
ncbi:hypothetical protein ADEAN_000499400 [Angomonas deanei]|uniref:Uncharacterized protein n=1 Tax=Angomonas deanei TaxID=59799 RepID=A0A7G2CCH8_9TRYP|nr:hypothetical protein ADEAN_000499400 [Angomonas deanei]